MTFDIGNAVSVDDDAAIDAGIAEMDKFFQFVYNNRPQSSC